MEKDYSKLTYEMTNLEIVVGEWQNEDPTEKITEMAKADDQAAAQIC